MAYMQSTDGAVFVTEHPEYHPDCKKMTIAAGKLARREYCREQLRSMLKPGATVYTILRHVSASGMSRCISLACLDAESGRMLTIDNLTADALDYKIGAKQGLIVGGCGMDMGFHLVYALGSALWPNGTPEPHGRRNGEPDSAGGYALRHEWL